jgi:hypothetical protein
MVRFPKARHDDQVDALSWLGLVVDQVQSADTPEEEEQYEYLQSLKSDINNGRSKVTGY